MTGKTKQMTGKKLAAIIKGTFLEKILGDAIAGEFPDVTELGLSPVPEGRKKEQLTPLELACFVAIFTAKADIEEGPRKKGVSSFEFYLLERLEESVADVLYYLIRERTRFPGDLDFYSDPDGNVVVVNSHPGSCCL